MANEMKTALVTGGSSGLGRCIKEALIANGFEVIDWSLSGEKPVDVTDSGSVSRACFDLGIARRKIDVLVNCAGVNFIDWHESTPIEEWDRLMNTNARAPWLTTKSLILHNLFSSPATICNIVSNASHMPMTNSSAYNASKGAAHILTLQMARELRKRHNLTVFGISPNKLKGTGMSEYISSRVCDLRGWTQEQAEAYQIASLPAGEETDPTTCAEFIAFLLSSRQRHKYLAGCILPYGA